MTSCLSLWNALIIGALGVDSESDANRAKEVNEKADRERTKRKEERKQEKQLHHEEKELERQKIREKYALNNKAPTKQTREQSTHTDKNCRIS